MQGKKLTLALHLEPETSDADTGALAILQQWYAQAKQNHDSEAVMEGAVRQFHHDVYLAGLQVYLLSPELCKQVAAGLGKKSASAETLIQPLESHGLWRPPQSRHEDESERVFSEAQLEQMAQVLAQAPTAPLPDHAEPSFGEAAIAEQGQTLGAILEELKQLRALAEKQSVELQKLRVGSSDAPTPGSRGPTTEELNVAEMAPQLAQMQKIREKGVF